MSLCPRKTSIIDNYYKIFHGRDMHNSIEGFPLNRPRTYVCLPAKHDTETKLDTYD